jgi:rhomboid protease GluP
MNNVFKSSKNFMPTYIIIALNIIVYVYTSIIGGNFVTTSDAVIWNYGQVNYLVMYYGCYWQLFTAMFVHVNIMHLLGNMFFLLIFGFRAEELFAIQEYLLIYFLSGLVGNLLTLLLGPSVVSAGASGAIFGLFGACIVYFRRAIGQSIIGALMYAFFLLMIGSGSNVNYLAHLGGLAVGLLIGYGLATKRRFRVTYRYSYSLSI